MSRNKLKLIIDLGMLISFIAVFITGLIKFPLVSKIFRIDYKYLAQFNLNLIHDWSGIIMGLLILAHLALNWKWIVVMLKKYLTR